jgi:hypothetical protein
MVEVGIPSSDGEERSVFVHFSPLSSGYSDLEALIFRCVGSSRSLVSRLGCREYQGLVAARPMT